MEQEQVQTIFDEVTSYEVQGMSCKSYDLYCYLINDGGVLIASNRKAARVRN